MTAIELCGIQHSYARTVALRGISLSVEEGETVAITGPSGCGKSTLLYVASGIIAAQTGTAHLLGHDLTGLDDTGRAKLRRRSVGVVLQHGQLVPDLRVVDNVALPLLLDGIPPDAARTAAGDWLAQVGLGAVGGAYPSELSGGQSQRAAVARALVTGPQIIVADEPTGSMDSVGGELLLDLLLQAVSTQRAALLLVTHDNTVAARADREVRLRDGAVEHDVAIA